MTTPQKVGIWPTIQEYDEAFYNAPNTIIDNDIKHGKPLQDATGILHLNRRGHKYACVYRVGDWVVKCLTGTPPTDIYERYQAINAFLKENAKWLPFLVPQIWVERAIYVNGKYFPFIKSAYVKHILFGKFLEEKHSEPPVVASLAKQFLSIVSALETLRIAHGDLDITNLF